MLSIKIIVDNQELNINVEENSSLLNFLMAVEKACIEKGLPTPKEYYLGEKYYTTLNLEKTVTELGFKNDVIIQTHSTPQSTDATRHLYLDNLKGKMGAYIDTLSARAAHDTPRARELLSLCYLGNLINAEEIHRLRRRIELRYPNQIVPENSPEYAIFLMLELMDKRTGHLSLPESLESIIFSLSEIKDIKAVAQVSKSTHLSVQEHELFEHELFTRMECFKGLPSRIKLLFSERDPTIYQTRVSKEQPYSYYYTMLKAAYVGNLKLIQCLSPLVDPDLEILEAARQSGNLELMKFVLLSKNLPLDYLTVNCCIRFGKKELLEFLLHTYGDQVFDLDKNSNRDRQINERFASAVESGDVATLKMIIDRYGAERFALTRSYGLLGVAAKSGKIAMMEYLTSPSHGGIRLKANGSILYIAVELGHIELVKWLMSSERGTLRAKSNRNVLDTALQSGDVALAKMVIEDYGVEEFKQHDCEHFSTLDSLAAAIASNTVAMMKFITAIKFKDGQLKLSNETLLMAAKLGALEIVKWLISPERGDARIRIDSPKDILVKILDSFSISPKILEYFTSAESGKQQVALTKELITDWSGILAKAYTFAQNIYGGKLSKFPQIAWLILKAERLEIVTPNLEFFYSAVKCGDLNLAKWLASPNRMYTLRVSELQQARQHIRLSDTVTSKWLEELITTRSSPTSHLHEEKIRGHSSSNPITSDDSKHLPSGSSSSSFSTSASSSTFFSSNSYSSSSSSPSSSPVSTTLTADELANKLVGDFSKSYKQYQAGASTAKQKCTQYIADLAELAKSSDDGGAGFALQRSWVKEACSAMGIQIPPSKILGM